MSAQKIKPVIFTVPAQDVLYYDKLAFELNALDGGQRQAVDVFGFAQEVGRRAIEQLIKAENQPAAGSVVKISERRANVH